MQLARIVASVLIGNAICVAQLVPETAVRVNACLGAQAPSDTCFDRLRLQALDGTPLTANVTLGSPGVQAQLNINSNSQAGYGVLHAGSSSTLDLNGAPLQASTDVHASFTDVLTISYAPLNGQPGTLYVRYTLSGSASSGAQNNAFADVQVSTGSSLEQAYSTRHSNSAWGPFLLLQPIRFVYGTPFGLKLELATTNSFGTSGDSKSGVSLATNIDTGLVLSGLLIADQSGNVVSGAQFSSVSGTRYGPNGVASAPPAVPADQAPMIASIRPSSGPVGTPVTVTGSGFVPTSGGTQGTPGGGGDWGGNTVQLGLLQLSSLKNLNSADGVTLQFEIPRGVSSGMYSLTVANANGVSNALSFTVAPN